MKVYTLPVGAIQTNCYIVESKEKNAAIVDPGDQPELIIKKLEELALTPTVLLLTHGHFDHIGGVKKLRETYPDLTIYLGKEELEIVNWSKSYLAQMGHAGSGEAVEEHAVLLADGDTVTLDELTFTVMHTPGHTKGSIMYLVEDAIFSGDTVFREEIGRCDLFTGSYETMLHTLGKIYNLAGDYRMFPGHEEPTTLEHERQHNPYMKMRKE